jgi:hypothetical protein
MRACILRDDVVPADPNSVGCCMFDCCSALTSCPSVSDQTLLRSRGSNAGQHDARHGALKATNWQPRPTCRRRARCTAAARWPGTRCWATRPWSPASACTRAEHPPPA